MIIPVLDSYLGKGHLKVGYAHSTLQEEAAQAVIQKHQIIPLVLARCPGFRPFWEKHLEFWEGEEAGIYNNLGAFATFIVDAYGRQDTGQVIAAFKLIEELLADGNEEVRTAAAIGFLEDVRNIASWRPFGSVVFVQWLGPNRKKHGLKLRKCGEIRKALRMWSALNELPRRTNLHLRAIEPGWPTSPTPEWCYFELGGDNPLFSTVIPPNTTFRLAALPVHCTLPAPNADPERWS